MVGAVAQLGEHLLCKQGVSGSIPLSSTMFGLTAYSPCGECLRRGLALARSAVRPLLELCGGIEAELRKRDLRAGNRLPRPRSASPKGGTARERKQNHHPGKQKFAPWRSALVPVLSKS